MPRYGCFRIPGGEGERDGVGVGVVEEVGDPSNVLILSARNEDFLVKHFSLTKSLYIYQRLK